VVSNVGLTAVYAEGAAGWAADAAAAKARVEAGWWARCVADAEWASVKARAFSTLGGATAARPASGVEAEARVTERNRQVGALVALFGLTTETHG
jgi:hypothetical protein